MYCRKIALSLAAFFICTISSLALADRQPANIARPRDESWWQGRYRHNLLLAAEQEPDVIFLGDSITQLLADNRTLLKQLWPTTAITPLGIGGDRTQNLLWRIETGQELDEISPKVAVILIGTNNLAFNSDNEIVTAIGCVVKATSQKLPKSRILVAGLLPRGVKTDPFRARINRINASLLKLKSQNVGVVNINDALLEGEDLRTNCFTDNLHPSPFGFRILLERIKPSIDAALKDKSPEDS